MSRTALIVDGNNRLYSAYFAYEDLSFRGKSTSCIYGMPSMIRALINEVKPDKMYIAWDGHLDPKAHRQKILPSYKEHRKSNLLVDLDDLIRQKLILQEMFGYLGVRQVLNEDMEGDDIIYALMRGIRKKFDYVIINSSDKDFNQLLSKKVKIYSDSKRALITRNNVESYFGYSAKETVDYLSLVGDTSDDIPGLDGCGKKTARALLDSYGSVSNFLESGNSFPRVNRDRLLEVYPRNRRLISLPYFYNKFVKGKKSINYLGSRNPKFQKALFEHQAIRHGVKRFLDPNFTKPFKLLRNGN